MGSQQSGLVDLLLQANLELDGPDAGIETGYSVAGARDVNGDGRPDVLVGAPDVGASAGSAYVVYGFGVAKVAYAPVKAMVGHALAARKPKTLRRTGAASFFVLPALPAGLRLDAQSGVLSGTPRKVQPARRYTVTIDRPDREDDGAAVDRGKRPLWPFSSPACVMPITREPVRPAGRGQRQSRTGNGHAHALSARPRDVTAGILAPPAAIP